jgi:hypothetical protein
MFISRLKTIDSTISVEHYTFSETIKSLSQRVYSSLSTVLEAIILEETSWLDDQFPDFSTCKLVASLRTIK